MSVPCNLKNRSLEHFFEQLNCRLHPYLEEEREFLQHPEDDNRTTADGSIFLTDDQRPFQFRGVTVHLSLDTDAQGDTVLAFYPSLPASDHNLMAAQKLGDSGYEAHKGTGDPELFLQDSYATLPLTKLATESFPQRNRNIYVTAQALVTSLAQKGYSIQSDEPRSRLHIR